jgi:RepB DNA-primase from phage plasmid
MTNANFKDDPIRRFDRELVHAHVRLLHDLAAKAKADLGIDGQLILACYGENPDTGVKPASQVMKFGIGHGLEEMVDVIMALEHHPHLNVYAPFHIVRFGLGARERGGLQDIVAVLALVVDQDADKEKAGELPLPPHYVIESSPGNKQPVYVLAKAMRMEEACLYAKALQRFTSTDSGTGDVAHVWRVPGTLNWPSKEKVKRNRPRTPQPVRVLEPWQGEVIDAAALRAKLGEHFQENERPVDDPVTNIDWATSADREALLARLGRIGALEIIGWFDVACIDKDNGDRSNHSCRVIMKLFELGFSEGDVLALMLGTECAKRYTSEEHLRDDIARLKQKKAKEELLDYVKRLNQNYAVVLMEGQVLIVREQDDVPHFISPAHFHLWHANDTVEIQISHGKTKHTPVSRLWISHPARRQYSRVVFDPRDTNPLHYNLWRGFAVTADASKGCDKFLAHIRANICSGNKEHFDWVMAFLAHMVQRPWEKPGVSLVLRGCEGVGKGFFAGVIGELCPQHYVVISQAAQLTGKFNAHFNGH